jgi:hypothetical protein
VTDQTDQTTDAAADEFDPSRIADIVHGRAPAPRLTNAQRYAQLAALEIARDEDMQQRAEDAHTLRAERAQAAADYRDAEAARIAAMSAEEIARRARRH